MTKDFLGNELNKGDKVAFIKTHYREFTKGTIKSVNKKKVLLEYDNGHDGIPCIIRTLRFHRQVILCEAAIKTVEGEKMTDIELVKAPWSDEEIEALEAYQCNGRFHPYTCVCGESLSPYKNGWECDYCHSYHQDWAHKVSIEAAIKAEGGEK